jgi:hypothetical protein
MESERDHDGFVVTEERGLSNRSHTAYGNVQRLIQLKPKTGLS